MTKQEQLATIADRFASLVSTAWMRDGAEVQQAILDIRAQAAEYGLTDNEVWTYTKDNYYIPVQGL